MLPSSWRASAPVVVTTSQRLHDWTHLPGLPREPTMKLMLRTHLQEMGEQKAIGRLRRQRLPTIVAEPSNGKRRRC
jgi:hypothetical protein